MKKKEIEKKVCALIVAKKKEKTKNIPRLKTKQ